ncbi:MAG: glycosyltransferase family 4 protein, partial [Pyrodictiaceae archaeon]
GGAEVYTHEVARRLARQGHEIVLATSRPQGLPREEVIDGYRVVRAGNKYTVYLWARRIYKQLRGSGWRPDVVVDEVNTIPFLAPRYVDEPVVMLIHQLCKECWSSTIHPLVQPLGWWLEKRLHKTYIRAARDGRLRAVVTVSQSTKQDLVGLGYPGEKIHIVHNGLDWSLYKDCTDSYDDKEDLVVYISRITPYKRVEDLVRAWRIVEKEYRSARLVIAGRAEQKYLRRLTNLARKLGLKRVEFRTNIPAQEKKQLLARAKILAYTSTREGWGQTVVEAAACRTPAVAYNVPGLRDSVKHMETGILVEPGNIEQLAAAITRLLRDNKLRNRLAENAYKHAQSLNWDKAATRFLDTIRGSLHG